MAVLITAHDFISSFNSLVFILFMVFYAYQFFYIIAVFVRKHEKKPEDQVKNHKYAFLIAARNESSVIGQLIDSILQQDYPQELLRIFVVADNCTDNTADVARAHGATVYERFDQTYIGKGYALDHGLQQIRNDCGDGEFEGVFVFDADNLLTRNYVKEMNRIFDEGYPVVTSYRNSKNYGTNWITAGYSLWFLRESKYLNNARMLMDTNCAISGTGFVVRTDVLKEKHGWHYTLLTEDIEFSVDCAIDGRRIGYAGDAEFFDEQPSTFRQSWTQRLRWAKGFYQVLAHYGGKLMRKWVSKFSFSCYDLTMTIFPALFISLSCVIANVSVLTYALVSPAAQTNSVGAGEASLIGLTLSSLGFTVLNFYGTLFLVGLITTVTEWKKINCKAWKKILYLFTFPLFMFTYVPISIVALFKKVKWDPIKHNVTKRIDDMGSE